MKSALVLAVFLATSAAFADPPRQDAESESKPIARYEPKISLDSPKSFGFQRYQTRDKFDRMITFYLSKRRNQSNGIKRLPLVVCVQGSGGQSVFMKHKGMIASGGPESVVARDFGERVQVLVVEKPGIPFLYQGGTAGSSEEATREFNREFSLPRWVEAVKAATLATLKLPFVDSKRVLVLGHSEGGQVACQVAASLAQVTHVAVMAGGGPTQLYDLLEQARSGDMYDPNATSQQRVETLMEDWKQVLDAPEATDQFILGHTHLRWSSFLASSPIEAILKSKAKVFIAQGTIDRKTLPASSEVLYAELLARGRDVTYLRVENGDHAFMTEGDTTGEGWVQTQSKAIDWFLKP